MIREISKKKKQSLECQLDQNKEELKATNKNLETENASIEFELKTTSKIVSFSDSLTYDNDERKSAVCQWEDAVRKSKVLTSLISKNSLKIKDLSVLPLDEEKQQKEKLEDEIKSFEVNLAEESKKISAFESVFSKIHLNPITLIKSENESESNEQECGRRMQENKDNYQSMPVLHKAETVTEQKSDNDIEKEFVEKENLNDRERLTISNEEQIQDDGICSKDENDKEIAVQSTEDIPKCEHITKEMIDNDTENENDHNKSQNQQKNSKSAKNDSGRERFQNDYGIIIESKSKKDRSVKTEPCNSDERLEVLESKEFPDMFQLYTDIFHIFSESTAESPREGIRVPANDVTFKVLLPIENSSYYEYKGAIKVGNTWTLIDNIIQDGYMVFEVDQVESFCVLSLVRQEHHIILPAGSQFISKIDSRIQVIFPPNAVTQEEHITFKIHPVNISCILKRTTGSINNSININAITPGISTVHMKFKKMFKVQLPLLSIPEPCDATKDNIYYIFKWNDDGSFEFTDLQPVVGNGSVCFEANSFSGYGCVGTSGSNNTSSLASVVQEAYGLKKWCKILFFVGKLRNYELPIMLECVDLERVSEICEKREKYGYQFISEWTSKDFFLSPDKTIITVDVKGIFRIPKESGVKHPRLSFVPVAQDNFTRFLVELRKAGRLQYGMLVLREYRQILDEIYYYPHTTKKSIPAKLTGNRGNEPAVTERPTIVPNPIEKDFFTERGLLALSKSMNPDTMLDVCINMDMTTSTYETIRQKYGVTTLGNIALWKAALDQQPYNKKLENLIKALIASGQKSVADKVQQLHSKGEDLHTI